MLHTSCRVACASAAVAAAALTAAIWPAQPAKAIIGGSHDTTHVNAGALIWQPPTAPDRWAQACSGVLVAPTVFLTAGHCADLIDTVIPMARAAVTFEAKFATSFPLLWPVALETYGVVGHDAVPGPRPLHGNEPPADFDDVGVLLLDRPVEGVPPATIVPAGTFENMTDKDIGATVVGYGCRDTGTGTFLNGSPNQRSDGRYSFDASIVSWNDVASDRFLKLFNPDAGTCPGDSGGPVFYNGAVAAVGSFIQSLHGESPTYSYRLDTPMARAFLAPYLFGSS